MYIFSTKKIIQTRRLLIQYVIALLENWCFVTFVSVLVKKNPSGNWYPLGWHMSYSWNTIFPRRSFNEINRFSGRVIEQCVIPFILFLFYFFSLIIDITSQFLKSVCAFVNISFIIILLKITRNPCVSIRLWITLGSKWGILSLSLLALA